jgi:predicted flap endonuclease-1-like 5' DNA nuclease
MMAKWILAVLTLLVFSLAGIAVLALLLWWLLRRQKAEQAAPHVEIDAEPSGVDTEPGEAAAEAGPLALDVDVVEIEALKEEPVEDVPVAAAEVGEPAPGIGMEAETPTEEAVPPVADDLKRIGGIGPRISSVLQSAGITTFATLAATDVSRLEEVLEAENPRLLRLANPATWPEQAQLAAAGDWEGLEALQNTLKGGRAS